MKKALRHSVLIPLPEHEPARIGETESVLRHSSREWLLCPDSVPSPFERTSIVPASVVAAVVVVAVAEFVKVGAAMVVASEMWTDAARTRCSDSLSSPPILALDSASSNANPGTLRTDHSIYGTL